MRNLYNIEDWFDLPYARLGEILIEAGKINLLHLSMVLDIQRLNAIPMGEIFLSMKVISKKDLKQALLIQETLQKRRNA